MELFRKKRKYALRIENGLKCGTSWFPFLLLIPALFNFIVFWVYPNFNSIILSFQEVNTGEWTIGNYSWVLEELFTKRDGVFAIAMRNTLLFFTQGYFVTQTFNIVLAYFIYKKILLGKFFRFILYMPNMLAGIILVSIYKNLIGAEGPLVTALLDMGVIDQPIMFLNTTKYAIWASLAYSLWPCVGGVFLWCSGAMARIPKDLFEAASLDGITPWKEFIHIVLPMISGTLSTLYIIGIAGILGSGGATMYLTFGEYETTTLSFWIFKQVYTGGGDGTSSALGILMTLVTIPLIFFVKWLAKKVSAEVSY